MGGAVGVSRVARLERIYLPYYFSLNNLLFFHFVPIIYILQRHVSSKVSNCVCIICSSSLVLLEIPRENILLCLLDNIASLLKLAVATVLTVAFVATMIAIFPQLHS